MELIRDDPIIAHIMRTGFPPWIKDPPDGYEDEDWEDGDGDVYFGNETSSF
jgi:hypothetical protein